MFIEIKDTEKSISAKVNHLRSCFNSDLLHSYAARKEKIQRLKQFVHDLEDDIRQVLYLDLKKPGQESFLTEIAMINGEIDYTLKNLSSWMKKKRVRTILPAQPGKSYLYPEPLGVVLILAPWNYPIQLSLVPVIGALAAGNTVVLKPSELAPESSAFLAKHLPRYLDQDCLSVIEGGIHEATALLDEHFDHIFYTGNGNIGKIVMTAAAKHLTPVTLELGGKSPCIVDFDADIHIAAERILWGKFCNAGQTCIAPDYVLAHESIEESLLQHMKKKLIDFYGENPEKCPHFGRIINVKHYQRLMSLIAKSNDVFVGGKGSEDDRYVAPTIIRNVDYDAPIMNEEAEIFGPILPIVKVKDIKEAVAFINKRPKPLTLYLFSKNRKTHEFVEQNTYSGSLTINHTLIQNGIPTLPFGGIGASGMGAYHGKASFDTFSHYKSVFVKPSTKYDISRLLYPPYTKFKEKILKLVL